MAKKNLPNSETSDRKHRLLLVLIILSISLKIKIHDKCKIREILNCTAQIELIIGSKELVPLIAKALLPLIKDLV